MSSFQFRKMRFHGHTRFSCARLGDGRLRPEFGPSARSCKFATAARGQRCVWLPGSDAARISAKCCILNTVPGRLTMTPTGKNRIMIFGPKDDGTYVAEFRTAEGEALAISIPRTETAVIRYFQERMPYGLFVPEVEAR